MPSRLSTDGDDADSCVPLFHLDNNDRELSHCLTLDLTTGLARAHCVQNATVSSGVQKAARFDQWNRFCAYIASARWSCVCVLAIIHFPSTLGFSSRVLALFLPARPHKVDLVHVAEAAHSDHQPPVESFVHIAFVALCCFDSSSKEFNGV